MLSPCQPACAPIRRVRERIVKFRDALAVGLRSVRANAVPMVVLWLLAAATVVGYYFVPGVAAVLEPLRVWQTESGGVAAFLNRVIF